MKIKTNTKLRLRLESFNYELLNSSCREIRDILQNTQLDSLGVIPLPTQRRVYCVLRSPHVNKDSREHFEIRIHKRVLEIDYNSGLPVLDLISKVDLPSGVFSRISFL